MVGGGVARGMKYVVSGTETQGVSPAHHVSSSFRGLAQNVVNPVPCGLTVLDPKGPGSVTCY